MYGADYVIYNPQTHTATHMSDVHIVVAEAFPKGYEDMTPSEVEECIFDEEAYMKPLSFNDYNILRAATHGFIAMSTKMLIDEQGGLTDEDNANLALLQRAFAHLTLSTIFRTQDLQDSDEAVFSLPEQDDE